MSDFYTRQHYKSVYGPLSVKTLHNVLKRELMEHFGFENMGLIADGIINRFFEIIKEYAPLKERIVPGQLLWLAASAKERCGYGKSMLKTKLVPVVLTLISSDDICQMAEGEKSIIDLRPYIVARLLKEAKQQGGVLALSDVGLILGVSQSTISRDIEKYHKKYPNEKLPYRGTIHDLGPTITHKRLAIELKLKGLLTQEIARKMHHDPSCIDRYLNDFNRVKELYDKKETVKNICFYTKLSKSLVLEYIQIIQELVLTNNE